MLYLALSLASLLLAITLWRLGRRGKRLDNHPTCRKCGYDLVGLPPDSLRCSECGADIKAKRALRIGNRRRYPALAWTGLMLILLSLPAIGISGHDWWQHFNKYPWLPFSLLEREYKAGDFDAEAELSSRLAHGKLSKSQASQLVRNMTAWQDDPTVKIFFFNDVITASRGDLLAAGVDPALLDGYDDHPYRVDAKYHAQIIRGTFFPFRLTFDIRPNLDLLPWEREVTGPKARVQIDSSVIDLKSFDELPVSEDAYDRDSMVVGTDAPEFWRHEHNGRIEGTLVVEMDVASGRPSTNHVTRSIPFSAQVVAPGTSTITRIANPTLDAQMAAAFHGDKITMNNQDHVLLERILPGFRFEIGALPENVAMDVYFEQGGRKWNQGVLIRAAGRDPLEMYLTPNLARQRPPDEPPRYFIGLPWRRGLSFTEAVPTDVRPDLPLELVLKSSPGLAATHSGFDRVWQGEIRIPIPIRH